MSYFSLASSNIATLSLPGLMRLCNMFSVTVPGLMPLPSGLAPLPNLPNLNLPLPDLSAVSLAGPPAVGNTGMCVALLSNSLNNFLTTCKNSKFEVFTQITQMYH